MELCIEWASIIQSHPNPFTNPKTNSCVVIKYNIQSITINGSPDLL